VYASQPGSLTLINDNYFCRPEEMVDAGQEASVERLAGSQGIRLVDRLRT
jgi:hypothetical protein